MSGARERTTLPIVPAGVGDFREAGAEAAEGWRSDRRGVRLVPTHCCFCGVQCGMYLKVDAEGHVFCTVRPPSTGITAPVMNDAAGRTSESVIWATSSGSP